MYRSQSLSLAPIVFIEESLVTAFVLRDDDGPKIAVQVGLASLHCRHSFSRLARTFLVNQPHYFHLVEFAGTLDASGSDLK